MAGWQPPHPRATIWQARTCLTGQQRYTSRALALASIPSGFPIHRDAAECPHCDGGWHLTDPPTNQPQET
ncbi:MAG: hypothetical protein HOY79_04290 [Streptomyces sp.]|nr:hypothetical protein [Streptomyces sp.]NUS15425.1 hypothetical protein [Streptomyces sp.]NUS24117.1 hypothetical protein [Streptomyces sp.]